MSDARGIGEPVSLAELLERLLDTVAGELERPAFRASATTPSETPLQAYTRELLELCERVLREADETTAVTFWSILIAVAARHGARAGGLT